MMKENKLRLAIAENPVTVLFLGACPAIAQTADVRSALAIGCAVLAVMLLSSVVVAIIRGLLNERTKIPAYVLISAGFVTLTELLMNAFFPDAFKMLGVYLTVIAANLLVFSREENADSLGKAVCDSIVTGLSFLVLLLATSALRELLGSASFAGKEIELLKTYKIPMLSQVQGGFFMLAIMLALVNKLFGKENVCSCSITGKAAGFCAVESDERGE